MSDKAKIVAIDDEIEFVKTIDQFFSARGHDVNVAMTGTSGIEMIDYHKPDVVLVDLKLPGMDGDEILEYICNKHPSIKVIVITAYNDGGKTRKRLLSMGAFAHFDKPLSSLRDLSNTINEAFAKAE